MSPRKKNPANDSSGTLDPVDDTTDESPEEVQDESEGQSVADASALAFAEASVAAAIRTSPALPPCALESAPVGTKCVVSRPDESGKVARLINSAGSIDLPKDDIFYTLPPGAKVTKRGETIYVAHRLGVNDQPLFTVSSAREAVTRFLTEAN